MSEDMTARDAALTEAEHEARMAALSERAIRVAEDVWTEDEPTLAEYELAQAILTAGDRAARVQAATDRARAEAGERIAQAIEADSPRPHPVDGPWLIGVPRAARLARADALPAEDTPAPECHNGHPFEPGRTVDDAPGESHPDWCNTCGEARKPAPEAATVEDVRQELATALWLHVCNGDPAWNFNALPEYARNEHLRQADTLLAAFTITRRSDRRQEEQSST